MNIKNLKDKKQIEKEEIKDFQITPENNASVARFFKMIN